jgi:hypothetical protein
MAATHVGKHIALSTGPCTYHQETDTPLWKVEAMAEKLTGPVS